MNEIGLIGFGRFGQVLYQHLKEQLTFRIYDPLKQAEQRDDSIPFGSLEQVCQNPYLILAVPVSAMETVCRQLAPHLRSEQVVMDVCAVKQYPLRIMEKYLPESVQLLGSHPLFGPDSLRGSFRGHLMLVTPHRIQRGTYRQIADFWRSLGLQLVEMSAEEQDRLMAWTLALTHFLGRGLVRLPLPQTTVATRDFLGLVKLTEKINRDTLELFQDMHRYNPYTREMRELLLKAFTDLKEELDGLERSR